MKTTKKQLIKIWNTLESLSTVDFNKRFSYCVVRNKKKMRDEIESLKEAQKPSEEYIAYDRARIGLCEQLCERDEAGKPLLNNKNYVFNQENTKVLDERMKQLVDANKEIINDNDKMQEEFASILEEEVEIDVYQINLDDFPETITPEVMEVLDDLIKEE